jgi:short-subunit dehydrogenase
MQCAGTLRLSRATGRGRSWAGASEGIGAAFATELAARGLNVALVARRGAVLEALASDLERAHGIQALPIVADLGTPDMLSEIQSRLADRQVGLVVANAVLSLIGPFLDQPLEAHLREIDVNCRAPLSLAYAFGHQMAQRGHGGIILMSSLAGFQGGPFIANYAATRAYTAILAEGLWAELSHHGVDALTCCAGATATPGLESSYSSPSRFAPPTMLPREVAREALDALGHGPTHVPGRANRVASQFLRRVLPRALTIRLMERATRNLSRSPTL